MTKVLLTGATGFVGSALLKRYPFEAVLGRNKPSGFDGDYHEKELGGDVDYKDSLVGVDVVVHCAAKVQDSAECQENQLKSFRSINVEGTLNLAKQAAEMGVKRFIFISTIKVYGEETENGKALTVDSGLNPLDAYAISKVEAELGLKSLSDQVGIEVVIVRPPLVYGPGVKGNFSSLLKLSKLPIPLPFSWVANKRSMVYVDNLVDLITVCIDHPDAGNRVFLVTDGEDVSLARLLTLIRSAMGKLTLLFPVPLFIFTLLGKLTGKSKLVARLVGDLQVDNSNSKKILNWNPPFTLEEGVKTTVIDFQKGK